MLEEGENLTVTQEDMSCAFYLFLLPSCWAPYFAIGDPLTPAQLNLKPPVGSNADTPGHLTVRVLPMGWSSSVGVMQAAHRQILIMAPADGAGLPPAREVRKTTAMPGSDSGQSRSFWQVYLDNFAAASIESATDKARLAGQRSAWHTAVRAAWERWGIPSAEDKAVLQDVNAKELGCEFRGEVGTMGTTRDRRHAAAALSLFVLSAPSPHRVWLSMLAGRWSFCFQFRRPVSSIFTEVWRHIGSFPRCRFLPQCVGEELLAAIGLAPLMVTDLRTQPDLLVTASDASEHGGGACAAAGLTREGVDYVQRLPRELPARPARGLVLLELFGGISAGRRALDLLGIVPIRHISAEMSPSARRAATSVYPDIIHVNDVRELTR